MENLFQILVQRGALPGVEDGVISEVRRSVGLVRRDQTNEFLLCHGLQGVVQTPLISQRRDRVGGKLLPAEGAGAMGGVDERLVGKRQEFVVERVVEARAEVVGGPTQRGAQVRAADVSDKQSVARKDGVWFCGVLLEIEDQDRDRLDGVAGGFEDFKRSPGNSSVSPSFIGTKAYSAWARGAEMDRRAATVA